jgi:hypothetical protein
VAVLEVAEVQAEGVGVPEAWWWATPLVVVVVRGEDQPGVAGAVALRVRRRRPPPLSGGSSTGRRPRACQTSTGILSAPRPVVNGFQRRSTWRSLPGGRSGSPNRAGSGVREALAIRRRWWPWPG